MTGNYSEFQVVFTLKGKEHRERVIEFAQQMFQEKQVPFQLSQLEGVNTQTFIDKFVVVALKNPETEVPKLVGTEFTPESEITLDISEEIQDCVKKISCHETLWM